jgi:heat-inducible transcriptional repressor
MTDSGGLNGREQQILHAVVHSYITTAEPVGSRTLVKRFNLDVSAATVRNTMADLEERGYLEQVHTSSGRVPTRSGYRYYIDYLMQVQELTLAERQKIESELHEKLNDADEVLRQTSHLLALVSHQTGLAEVPDESSAVVQRIELMPLAPQRIAVLMADNFGRVRTTQIHLEAPLMEDEIPVLNRFLNQHLRGVHVDRLAGVIQEKLRDFLDEQRVLAERVLQVLNLMPARRNGQIFLDGATQLFEQPEFNDVIRAREVFGFLEEEDRLVEILRKAAQDNAQKRGLVIIGGEEEGFGLQGISVIASPYEVNGKAIGMIGVLGPQRMPYSRLTSLVDYTAGMVGRLLSRLGA